jgi:hypothetical protein
MSLITLTQEQVVASVVRDMIRRGELSTEVGVAARFGFKDDVMTMFLIQAATADLPQGSQAEISLSPEKMVN